MTLLQKGDTVGGSVFFFGFFGAETTTQFIGCWAVADDVITYGNACTVLLLHCAIGYAEIDFLFFLIIIIIKHLNFKILRFLVHQFSSWTRNIKRKLKYCIMQSIQTKKYYPLDYNCKQWRLYRRYHIWRGRFFYFVWLDKVLVRNKWKYIIVFGKRRNFYTYNIVLSILYYFLLKVS